MALVEYELQRLQRIAENRKRMEDMGIFAAKDQLSACVERRNKHKQPVRVAPLGPKKPRASAGPPRKSTRLEGRPAPIYNEAALEKADGADRKTRGRLPEHHVASEEELYTMEHVNLLGSYNEPWELFRDGYGADGNRIYDKVNGMTCHQCRQKTLGRHTSCSECQTLHGVFCGDCLFMRYGENILEVEAGDHWVCPPCRGLCNCSFHRIRRGWAPTGTLYRRAIAEGYKSVAHYLVLTHQAGAALPEAGSAAAAAPAENPVEALTSSVVEAAAGQERSAEGVQGPGMPPKTSKKAARRDAETKTGSAAPKKRQSHINELLHKTRRGAAAKTGKAALSKPFHAGATIKAKALAAAVNVTPTGLGRITRGAAAALSRSAETIRAHVQSTLRCAA